MAMSNWPHIESRVDLERFYNRVVNATEDWESVKCYSYENKHFSHTPCEVCRRPLGGDRWDYSVTLKDGEELEYEVCVDCHEMIQFGDLNEEELLKIDEGV